MTANRNYKRRIRARAAKTGESYTAARQQLRGASPGPVPRTLTVAAAQLPLRPDPADVAALKDSGATVRALMRRAREAGAALVHFPEGALTSPHKRVMSSAGPQEVGPADWARADWAQLDHELSLVAALARELQLWVAVGGIQRREGEARPANCLFVISDRGQVTGRYDERMLSRTKAAFMYAPGSAPLVFTVNGLRFGCALGMETHYAELFLAYEELGADCVLFSTAGDPGSPGVFAIEAAGHAAANSLWVSYAGPAQEDHAPAGLLTPEGTWAARCATHDADLAIAEITGGAAAAAREWRRVSRAATGARPGPT